MTFSAQSSYIYTHKSRLAISSTMDIPRGKFIRAITALSAGNCMIPSLFLASCNSPGDPDYIRLDYTGTEKIYKYYKPFFRKLKKATVKCTSFEAALNGNAHAVFLDSGPPVKSTHIILLLENNKDIITPYPLANSLNEYKKINEFMVRYDRRIGMLNPLYFYPSIRTLKEWLAAGNKPLSGIRISCHPDLLSRDYKVTGLAGAVQPLQRIVSHITGKFPLSLVIEQARPGGINHWIFDYSQFQTIIQVDHEQTGWIIEIKGDRLNALTDHTGLLRLNNEVEPRLFPSPSIWEKSMTKNLQDFLQAIRFRSEPAVNTLDGLASIILNQAAGQTLSTGKKVSLSGNYQGMISLSA